VTTTAGPTHHSFPPPISTFTELGALLFKALRPRLRRHLPNRQLVFAGTGQQVPANRNVMLQNPLPKSAAATAASTSAWTFGQREEDLGDTCFVEAKRGDVTVSFNQASG